MPINISTIHCPVSQEDLNIGYPVEELNELVAYLEEDLHSNDDVTFKRGTVSKRAQLDCCKQALGPQGATVLSEALKNNTHVKSVLMGTGGIGNVGAKSVADLIQANENISTVYLGCNYIEEEGTKHLTQAMENNNSVRALWLKRNPIGPEGAKLVAGLLTQNRNLRTIDLTNTLIGKEGLKLILDVIIENNYPVERMFLGGNYFDENSAKLISQLILKNSFIEELYISANPFGTNGIRSIIDAVAEKDQIAFLALQSCELSNDGLSYLFRSFTSLKNLKYLNLGRDLSARVLKVKENKLDDHSLIDLCRLIEENRSIQVLDITVNEFSSQGVREIEKSVMQNETLQRLSLGKGIHGRVKKNINEKLKANKSSSIPLRRAQDIVDIISLYR